MTARSEERTVQMKLAIWVLVGMGLSCGGADQDGVGASGK